MNFSLLAQQNPPNDAEAAAIIFGALFAYICCLFTFILIVNLPIMVGMWKVFEKAGKPGWAGIIPIYNWIVMAEIAGREIWFPLLMFIPFFPLQIAVSIILHIDLAKSFGKDVGYALGLVFLPFVFWPILGFGSAKYLGPTLEGPLKKNGQTTFG